MALFPLTKGKKLVAVVVGVAVIFFGLQVAAQRGWITPPGFMASLVPQKAVLPDVKDAQVSNVEALPMPLTKAADVPATLIRGEEWEWNAQINLNYANGGPSTTAGSLMEKHNVNLGLYRQDDTGQMQQDLVACAKELHDGAAQCSSGANFVMIMGDGSGQFLAGVNPLLKKLGLEYQAKVFGATGYSRNEDAFLTPPEVKHDPQAARGLLVAGVLRDGDWNIAQKWEGDNNIPNNPDEKTYDPNAVNWVNAADYLKAAEMYNTGYCEDRKLVKDGHPTSETKHVCVNAVVTWTPGDVNIAKGKGGLIKVVSSKQYRSQMPDVFVGPGNFLQKNRTEIEGMLAATFEAGDQIKAYDQALHKAADISAKIYNDQDGAYWYKYYKGSPEVDSQGLRIELGGSAVNNLADALILFGLQPGTNDNFRSTYTVFARIATQQYPLLFKDTPIPDVKDIEDRSYVTGAQALMTNGPGSEADTPTYDSSEGGAVISKRSYQINFETGRATLTPEGIEVVRQLKDQIAITGLNIHIDGYTDNVGAGSITKSGASMNQVLSEARAQAVKEWLQHNARANFPDSRFEVKGHGEADPVASNATAEGRERNRRVQITLTE